MPFALSLSQISKYRDLKLQKKQKGECIHTVCPLNGRWLVCACPGRRALRRMLRRWRPGPRLTFCLEFRQFCSPSLFLFLHRGECLDILFGHCVGRPCFLRELSGKCHVRGRLCDLMKSFGAVDFFQSTMCNGCTVFDLPGGARGFERVVHITRRSLGHTCRL